jgi:hypothetical protein
MAVDVVSLFMALLSFVGIITPSLAAQGEQRRSSYFNIDWDIPCRTDAGGYFRGACFDRLPGVVIFELRWGSGGRARSGTSECCRRLQSSEEDRQ